MLRRGPQRCEGVVGDLASDGQEAEDAAPAIVDQDHLQCIVGISGGCGAWVHTSQSARLAEELFFRRPEKELMSHLLRPAEDT